MKKRNTIQRKLVLEAIEELPCHPTAEEIYHKVALRHSSVSKGTVYRILSSLVQSENLQRLSMSDAADRFDADIRRHYHLKCAKCGIFLDLEVPGITEFICKLEESTGFSIDEHGFVFSGICKECQDSKPIGESKIN